MYSPAFLFDSGSRSLLEADFLLPQRWPCQCDWWSAGWWCEMGCKSSLSGANRPEVLGSISNEKDKECRLKSCFFVFFFPPQLNQKLCEMLLLGLLIDSNIWCMDQAYGEMKQEWIFLSKICMWRLLRFESLGFSVGTGHFDIGG